ncbi:DNA-processing protein DprA, partial [bacterium]|nr:DNA-processing protein DprA [bacterium]
MSNKDKYWIGFSSIGCINSAFTLRLFEHFQDIEKAWNCNDLSFCEGLSRETGEKFLRARDKTNLDYVTNLVMDKALSYITYEDGDYPFMLKNIDNPPAMFYYRGDLNGCNLNKTLAVVGSRRATTAAKDVLYKII